MIISHRQSINANGAKATISSIVALSGDLKPIKGSAHLDLSNTGDMPLPNILITGTPGTGKTQTSQLVAEKTGLRHINIGNIVKEQGFYEYKDEDFDSYILDEEKLLDYLEPIMSEGGNVVDFHSNELFPERWFELILVLRTDTRVLYDRLVERGYNDKKRDENIECEIMQVVLEEARESYDENLVHELDSNTIDDLDANVNRVVAWLDAWKNDHKA